MLVDLRQMRQFVAVAEELHFGRAAARLHIAQPPLSQSIKRLEEQLQCQLLARTNRKVELTPAGHVFLEEARRTLGQAEEAVRLARRAASDELAELRLTFVSAALFELLPAALRAYRERRPHVQIHLDERPTEAQLADLASGRVDLGILHPPVKALEGVEVRTVAVDPLVVALPRGSALARAKQLSLSQLAGKPLVLFPHIQGPALHRRIVQACRRAGFVPDIAQEARQMHTILSLVAGGLGLSLVPRSAQSMGVAGVVYRPLSDAPEDLVWELAIAWRPKLARRALREFVDVLGSSEVHLDVRG